MMAEQFKQFKIGELFDRAQLGDTNLKKTDLTDNGELVVTSGNTNCGILGRTTRKAKIFSKNTITVDMFGLVYYRDFSYKMVTHGRVMSLSSDIIKNREIGLYLAGSLSYLSKVFSYNNMATWKKIKELNIMLPVTPAGEPDFEYMAMRIRELEAERIRELEAYLRVTGFDDTTLSASEAQALTQKVQWKKFKVGDVFNEAQLGDTNLKKSDLTLTGDFVVTSGQTNSGVLGRTTREAKIFSENTLTIDMFGYAYYRDFPYKMVTHGRVMSLSSDIIKNREVGLFLATVLSRLTNVFSYNNMATWKKLKNMSIMLPVTVNGNIDFEYMQNYIRATEKRTIKGVVEYKDRVIAETKKVVND